MPKPRLLIADDHPLILEGLRRILERDFDLVGIVSDGRDLIAAADRLKPDAALVDISMPGLNGVEAMRRIRAAHPRIKLVVVSQHSDRSYIRAAFQAGAAAYVSKQSAAGDLLCAVREALNGRFYISETLTRTLPPGSFDPARNPGYLFGSELTPRQREVLQLIAEGKSAKEIAEALNVSPRTVEFHKASIMEELGVRSTAELTRYALANGIVTELE
jgi:DNA-binding NarL/FixJ family response regulator